MPSQRQPNQTFFVVISFCFNQVHQSPGNLDVVRLIRYTLRVVIVAFMSKKKRYPIEI